MRSSWKLIPALLGGLALLTLGAHAALSRVTTGWFEADLTMRSRLAVSAARSSLLSRWDDPAGLGEALTDIARDERIMAVAACGADGGTKGVSETYPPELSCPSLARPLLEGTGTLVSSLAGGRVHVSAVPLDEGGAPRRIVLLVHDLSFVDRREATTRDLLLAAYFFLALGASGLTWLFARLAWRGWTGELRAALAGAPRRGFEPLLRDVRALAERLAREGRSDLGAGRWGPDRLRAVLSEHLSGERIVVASNREPYVHVRRAGTVEVLHPASGLVSALEPVMRACSGTWVAHGSGDADRETADPRGRIAVPPGEDGYTLRRLWLTDAEERGYYYGFANEGLWPLCHLAHERPTFRASDWEQYQLVNRRFADAVCEEADVEDPVVLVQDYHLALAPRMIRERLPRATILTFWHVPWPNAERFGICPYRDEILAGMLGSSIVGFQTQQHANNFLDAVDAYLESRIDRTSHEIVQAGRRTVVRAYPISIEWPLRRLLEVGDTSACRRDVRVELGLPEDCAIVLGVDRLDYTKGIEERLRALDDLLARYPQLRGRVTYVQVAAPTRSAIERYRDTQDVVRRIADEVGARWAGEGAPAVRLLVEHHDAPSVYRLYRAADVCFVGSLHDGMNLVAKEFVAAREDERGVLVLSQFAGAARELTDALVVNPYDTRQCADALAAALWMGEEEQATRMRALRQIVAGFNVYRWAGRMLLDAAELRRRERVDAGVRR